MRPFSARHTDHA